MSALMEFGEQSMEGPETKGRKPPSFTWDESGGWGSGGDFSG